MKVKAEIALNRQSAGKIGPLAAAEVCMQYLWRREPFSVAGRGGFWLEGLEAMF